MESGHIESDMAAAAHGEEIRKTKSSTWLPWSLAGLFFVTTLVSHFRKHSHA